MNIDQEERKLEIFQYRFGLAAGAFVYPFFGWLSNHLLKVEFDTLYTRLPVSIYCFAALVLSFKSKFILKYFRFFILLGSFWIIDDYFHYFVQSDYHFYFSIGLTAMPFITLNALFYPIDFALYFGFLILDGLRLIKDFNVVFILTYSILMIMAFSMYILVFRSRVKLFNMLKASSEEISTKNKNLINIGELAAQVAHDIRSPVAALQAVSETLDNVDPKKRQLIEKSAIRIGQIADYLVSEYRTNVTLEVSSKTELRAQYLNEVIQDIVDEKQVLLKQNSMVRIDAPEMIKVPIYLNLIEFKRALSNILNNSIEAFDKVENLIIIKLKNENNFIKIEITDNGMGIYKEHMSDIFEKGVSFSKGKGTGLGLSHAKNFIDQINGKIEITSQKDKGTTVSLQLLP
jgi:signal transduction histidine kinase